MREFEFVVDEGISETIKIVNISYSLKKIKKLIYHIASYQPMINIKK